MSEPSEAKVGESCTATTADTIKDWKVNNNNLTDSQVKHNGIHVGDVNKTGPTPVVPPDGGWGWVVVFASFGISLLVDGVCFSFGIFFDEFREEFGTSKAVTSWIGSVLNGSYLIFGPIVSALVNMYGCRNVAITGSILSFVAFFLSTFSPNIAVLIFTYGFLGGVGFGLMYLPAIVMVGYYFERRRALATGIACCGSGIGAFLFAPFTEHLLHQYGWRGANWILSALVVHGLAFAIFFRPLTSSKSTASPNKVKTEPRPEESVALISPEDHITDVTATTPPSVDHTSQKSPVISDELKTQIYESLHAGQDLPPVYRTRSMTFHAPLTSTDGKSPSVAASDTARLAFSQDLSFHHRKRPKQHGSSPTQNVSVPPLQRKDIFYSGSIWHLKEFQEVGSAEKYRNCITETATSGEAGTTSGRIGFVQSFISVFDISLLKSPTFLIYGSSCFLCMAGFFVPFMYMPTHAIDMGLDTTSGAFLISIIGITNTIGRVAVGFVSDQSWADCLMINNVALICGGLATLFVRYYVHYYMLAIYAAVFGTAIAVFVSLRSIIMVELMGIDKLTTSFGFVIMCQGFSSLLGPPLAGAISDSTGNYNAAFYMAGIALTLSGIICLPLRRISKWEKSKNNPIAITDSDSVVDASDDTRGYELQEVNVTEEVKSRI